MNDERFAHRSSDLSDRTDRSDRWSDLNDERIAHRSDRWSDLNDLSERSFRSLIAQERFERAIVPIAHRSRAMSDSLIAHRSERCERAIVPIARSLCPM